MAGSIDGPRTGRRARLDPVRACALLGLLAPSALAQQCSVQVPNSLLYMVNPLTAATGEVKIAACNSGYEAAAASYTCQANGFFDTAPACNARTCTSTSVADSTAFTGANSIAGSTGVSREVVCRTGYKCLNDVCTTTCNGDVFTPTVQCVEVPCPTNSETTVSGGVETQCACRTNFLGTPAFDAATRAWTHTCLATCGLYASCPVGSALKATPTGVTCDTTQPSSCTESRCCFGIKTQTTRDLRVTEAGSSVIFYMALVGPPDGLVSAQLQSTDIGEGRVSPSVLEFRATDWNVWQAITVTGEDDDIDDGAVEFDVTATLASGDVNYAGLSQVLRQVQNEDDDMRGVNVAPLALTTREQGDTATFKVSLRTEPAGEVTIDMTMGAPGGAGDEGVVSPMQLKFTAGNWDIEREVLVRGLDDDEPDGSITYPIDLTCTSAADTNYQGLAVASVRVDNVDDDRVGVVVTPTTGLITSEQGSPSSFTVRLASKPSASVDVPLRSLRTDEGQITVGGVAVVKLIFTTANWNVAQQVVVTGQNDAIDDGPVSYFVVLDPTVSGDPRYSGVQPDDVGVTNLDDDTAGYTVFASSFQTTESGAAAKFTVKLDSKPLQDVTVRASSTSQEAAFEPVAGITFTDANYDTAQTLTAVGQDDDVQDGIAFYTISLQGDSNDPLYNGIAPETLQFFNTDNDNAGVRIVADTLVTSEDGAQGSFTVQLASQPTALVTLRFDWDNTEGVVDPTFVTINPSNWQDEVTVDVIGVDDDISDGDELYQITTTIETSDDVYSSDLIRNGVGLVSVRNQDNDRVGVIIEPSTTLRTTEYGGTDEFTVSLASEPTGDVTIDMTSLNVNEGVLSTPQLVFTRVSYAVKKKVTVTGVQDAVQDGDVTYSVSFVVTSDDTSYSGLRLGEKLVQNVDDDTPGFIFLPLYTTDADPNLRTTEDGGFAYFTVQLRSQPTSRVQLTFQTDATEARILPETVAFLDSNWRTPIRVTLVGVDDDEKDGDISYTVRVAQTVSEDINYNGLVENAVTAINTDLDTASFQVTPSQGLKVSEAGSSAEFAITLTSRPSDTVELLVTTDMRELTADPASVVFSMDDWTLPKRVRVTGVNDNTHDGDTPSVVRLNPLGSADAVYAALPIKEMVVTNMDDDESSIVFEPVTDLVTSEGGGFANISVRLSTVPDADVAFTVRSSVSTEGTVGVERMVFTSVNWNVPQYLIATGQDDDVDDQDQPWSLVFGIVESSDPQYASLTLMDLMLTNADNDEANVEVSAGSTVDAPLRTSESGTSSNVTFVLTSRPLAGVTIALSTNDPNEGFVRPQELVFEPDAWDTPQQVMVTGVDDDVDDGDSPYVVITNAMRSDDMRYDGLNPPNVFAENADNDTAGVIVTDYLMLKTTEGGGKAYFHVSLASQPTFGITIKIDSLDQTEGLVNPSLLLISPSAWNEPSTVWINGIDDDVEDENTPYEISLSTAFSADLKYNELAPNVQRIDVVNEDDDVPGLVVSPRDGLETSEAETAVMVSVRLATRPSAAVEVVVRSSAEDEGVTTPRVMVFEPSRWNVEQALEIMGRDDDLADGDQAYQVTFVLSSMDGLYNRMAVEPLMLQNVDNDTPNVHVHPTTGLFTSEQGESTEFEVSLSTQPTADVTVGLSTSEFAEAELSKHSLTFTSGNWNVKQVVLVTGLDDYVDDGDREVTIATSAARSEDPDYDGFNAADVVVVNEDDDTAGVTVVGEDLMTSEDGTSVTFTVVLTSEPLNIVNIAVRSLDEGEGLVTNDMLIFQPTQWNTTQVVTVVGQDDSVFDSNAPYVITMEPTSDDNLYHMLRVVDVIITNRDNDIAAIYVSQTEGVVTSEADAAPQPTFSVWLSSQPSDAVTIRLESSDLAEGTLREDALTFAPDKWNVQQTVYAQGVDDDVQDGNKLYTVRTLAAQSGDGSYNGYNAPDVLFVNSDDDVAAIVTSTERLVTTEGGVAVEFTLGITSEPTAGVYIEVVSSDLTEGVVTPEAVLFTRVDWKSNHTFRVSGVYDSTVDGDREYVVRLGVHTADSQYANLQNADIPAVNLDVYDECFTTGHVCVAGGQKCVDSETSPTSLRDFICECAGSATGSARGVLAACVAEDECVRNGPTCWAAGQMCVDPNSALNNDWRCECVPPQAPNATGNSQNPSNKLSSCILDECAQAITADNTAGLLCELSDQDCVDLDTSPSSLHDWRCVCRAPLVGYADRTIAKCSYRGECEIHYQTCGTEQTCDDPDVNMVGDWTCICKAPALGTAMAEAAQCHYDECDRFGKYCAAAGQMCTDPSGVAKADWLCQCPADSEGFSVAQAAECTVDECDDNTVCAVAGQLCHDPNTGYEFLNDWVCKCIAPSFGSQVGGPAQCTLSGECVAYGEVCFREGQNCVDPSLTVLNDWMCVCIPPYEPHFATAAPAVCVYDECTTKGHTCFKAGQTCTDPNSDPSSLHDWYCACVPPAVGRAVTEPGACQYSGACEESYMTCTSVGQACVDGEDENSFQCVCIPPQTGAAVRQSALCVLDECRENGKVCSSAGQLCVDPDTALESTLDWRCECPPPAQGRARASAASCQFDGECTTRSGVCTSVGQTCVDPTLAATAVDDWECRCIPPASGSKVAGTATCVYDECTDHADVCTEARQTCEDPNPSPMVLDDWRCRCVGSRSTGTQVGGVATCILDECMYHTICRDEGQQCVDPDVSPSSLENWYCMCPEPASGTAVGAPATCTYTGKCIAEYRVCTDVGQSCIDNINNGEWECVCVAPQTGRQKAGTATCILDECNIHGETCLNRGQTCLDQNVGINSISDWRCSCAGDSTGTAVGQAATCQYTGECVSRSYVCEAMGQSCEDKSGSRRLGDWTCVCAPPYTGKATAEPAVCSLDECDVWSYICTRFGQKCTDPNHSPEVKGDWQCSCVGSSATGVFVGGPATCIFDECTLHAEVCREIGQVCMDVDMSPSSIGDWRCNCVPPSTGFAVAKTATCTHVGECARFASICINAGQSCNDPDIFVSGNWECQCLRPYSGAAVGRPAECRVDECIGNAATCNRMGQTCHDPSNTDNDWVCNCIAPAVGRGLQEVASCEYQGECAERFAICIPLGQTCVDPDEMTPNDWRCVCPPPMTGAATGTVATCTLDECVVHAATCTDMGQRCLDPNVSPVSTGDWQCLCEQSATGSAVAGAAQCFYKGDCADFHQTCTEAGQSCYDPDLGTVGNWECVCIEPQLGKATRKAASCTLDECKLYSGTCTDAAQRCLDPYPTPSSTGDWECECIGSSRGSAVAGAAQCTYEGACVEHARVCSEMGQACFALTDDDWYCLCPPPYDGQRRRGQASCSLNECKAQDTCESFGQLCSDRNTSVASLNDWVCRCLDNDDTIGIMTPARCEFVGECVQNSIVCTAAGQTCKDPNPTRQNDWECRCVTPELGVATGKPATCELDECIQNDVECAKYGQICHDPFPLAASQGNWVCMCDVIYSKGVSMMGPVSCTLDECERDGKVCNNDGQICHDPDKDPSALDDWVCTCPGSGSTRAVSLAACEVHYRGQCKNNHKICTDAGQACQDNPDTDDWTCVCVEPMVGAAAGAVVSNCFYDECDKFRHVCEEAGQRCHDPAKEQRRQGDWLCQCPVPYQGTGVANVAECLYSGECAANAVVCTAMGQTCYDPDLNRLGDWQCMCMYPQTGEASKAEPAACELDECVVHKRVCRQAGQVCFDPDRSISSTSDWICSCIAPAKGHAIASPALCTYTGECRTQALVCSEFGQTCFDPSPKQNDWECHCPQPSIGSGVAQPATVCVMNECDVESWACSAMGQECDDLDETVEGTWVCKCVTPATGSALGTPATCTWQGECLEYAEMCVAAGQTCKDPDVGAEDDWICVCLKPFTGEAKGKAAVCMYDECGQNEDVCVAKGQVCHDVDASPSSLSDWVCKCPPPFYGAELSMPAVCKLDECVENGQLCTIAAQRCIDPDPTQTEDWVCVCVAPQAGRAVGAPATCDLDECTTYGQLCTSVGQLCEDEDILVSAIGDWKCICQGSGVGDAVAQPAACKYPGECTANHETCTSRGQACRDPDPTKTGDWECNCLQPMTGIATGAIATCNLDECGLHRSICSAAQQECVDPDFSQNSMNDWMCMCSVGGGFAVTRAATCHLDECLEHGVECLRFGQQCNDPNTAPNSLRDWACSCVGSAVGTATAGPAACEHQNECVVHAPVCVHAGQACYDPNVAVVDDWLCICVEPSIGDPMENGAAKCTLDECAHLGGVACISAGQTCTDMVSKSATLNDFICECSGSSRGIRTAAVAECDWGGECAAQAATCANEGKTCYDPNPEVAGDWYCACVHPAIPDPENSELCMTDECLLYGATCTARGQDCFDTNTRHDSVGNWVCQCQGVEGSAVARVAHCLVDECAGNPVCSDSGQECHDADTSADSLGDWSCRCVGSADGQARVNVASCSYAGECGQHFSTCTSIGQACLDPSPAKGDWQCYCIAPSTGRAVAKAAACEFDECMDKWKVCTASGQACVDSNTDSRSLDDWHCHCKGTSLGSALLEVAQCTYLGECDAHKEICLANGQACFDPSPNMNDWICKCVTPLVGFSTSAFVSECNVDECLVKGHLCTSHGQVCNDPNKAADSLGDWICECVENGEGSATARAAECVYTAECIANAHVCTAAGQNCADETGLARVGDWSCNCVTPYSGRANTKAALCTLDECTLYNGECESLEQSCEDLNIDVESLDDWTCTCVGVPISATAKPAICTYDECTVLQKDDVCNARGQACVDPNPVAMFMGDWLCQCVGSATGQAVAKAASCVSEGECVTEGRVCTLAGQGCVDPSEEAGDWACVCIPPAEKSSTKESGEAMCTLDECSTEGALCKNAGQLCVDSDQFVRNNWLCRCADVMGSAAQAVAECAYVDECAEEAAFCVRYGQTCVDPDPATNGDWACECVPPAATSSVTNSKKATCALDECVLHSTVCANAGQVCHDIDTDEASKGDWFCKCTGSGVGQTQGQVANCVYPAGGGCSMNAFKCAASGQACNDTQTGWACDCIEPRIGTADEQPALCQPAGECARYKYVCTAADQVCEDGNVEVSGDWVCRCRPPLQGSAVARAVVACLDTNQPDETYAKLRFVAEQTPSELAANEEAFFQAMEEALGLQTRDVQRARVTFDVVLPKSDYDPAAFDGSVVAAINARKPSTVPAITSANLRTAVAWREAAPQGRAARALQAEDVTGTATLEVVGGTLDSRKAWLEAAAAASTALQADNDVQAVNTTVAATAPTVEEGVRIESVDYVAQADGTTEVQLRLVVDDVSESLVDDVKRKLDEDVAKGADGKLRSAGVAVQPNSIASAASDCDHTDVCGALQRCVDPDGSADGSFKCICNATSVEAWNRPAPCGGTEATPPPPTPAPPQPASDDDDDDIIGMSTWVFAIFVTALVLLCLGLVYLLYAKLCRAKPKDEINDVMLREDSETGLVPHQHTETAMVPMNPDLTLTDYKEKTPPMEVTQHDPMLMQHTVKSNSTPGGYMPRSITFDSNPPPAPQSIQLESRAHTVQSMRHTKTVVTDPSGSPEMGTGWI